MAQLEQEALRPAASLVDTYSRPTAPSRSSATALAEALQGVQPALKQYLEYKQDDEKIKAEVEAQRFVQAHQEIRSYQEAVEKGLIQVGQSDVFLRAKQQQIGRAAALQAAAGLQAEYANMPSDLKDSEDPSALQAFLSEKAASFHEGRTQDELVGALPILQEAQQRVVAAHGSYTAERRRAEFKTGVSSEIGSLIDTAILESQARVTEWVNGGGKGEMPELDVSAVWGRVNQLKNTSRAMMLSGEEVNDMVLDTIVSSAVRRAELGDPNSSHILELATSDWTDPRTGKPVPGPARTTAGRVKLEAAQTRVNDALMQYEARIVAKQKAERETAKDSYLGERLPQIIASGRVSQAELAEAGRVFGPDAVKDLASAITSGRTIRDYDSSGAIAAHYAPMMFNPEMTPDEAFRHFMQLRDPQTQQRYLDDYNRLREHGEGAASRGASKLRADPVFGPYLKAIDASLDGKGDPLAALFPADPVGKADAMARFQSDILEYAMAHPEATRGEKREFALKTAKQYQEEAALLNKQAQGSTAPAPAATPAVPQKPTTFPSSPVGGTDDDTPPSLRTPRK